MKKKRILSETSSSGSDVDMPYTDKDSGELTFDDDSAGSCLGCHLSNGAPSG